LRGKLLKEKREDTKSKARGPPEERSRKKRENRHRFMEKKRKLKLFLSLMKNLYVTWKKNVEFFHPFNMSPTKTL